MAAAANGAEVTVHRGRRRPALHTIRTATVLGIASGPGGVWVTRQADVVRYADVSSIASAIDRKIPIRSSAGLTQVAVGADGVWVLSDSTGHTLWRLDPRHGRVQATIDLPFAPAGIAASPDAVWVTAQLNDDRGADRSLRRTGS